MLEPPEAIWRDTKYSARLVSTRSARNYWLNYASKMNFATDLHWRPRLSAADLCHHCVRALWNLPSVIMSFQPSFVSGVLFFAVATVSGLSMVATYLFLIYGAAAGTAYVAAKNLGGTARIGQGRRGYAPRYIRHGYGPGRRNTV